MTKDMSHERKDAFWKSDQLLRSLFNEAHDIILIHGYTEQNIPGPFLEINDFACFRLGYSREEFLQLNIFDIILSTEAKDVPVTSRLLTDRKQLVFEKTLKCKSGELISVEVNACVIIVEGRPYTISICRDITDHKKHEAVQQKLVSELSKALEDVKKLSGLLPICANCKKIRDDKGYWHQIEVFLMEHSEAEFTHSLCKECAKKLYPDLYKEE
jgi:PAS domain S-box-containing protein